jgi:hypothetical protein
MTDTPPTTADRERIELAIHSELTEYRLGRDTGMIVQRIADAVLGVLPARSSAERVRALHQPDANGECQHCHYSSPCPTVQVLDEEADAVSAKPWLTDSARIGRTLIWSWADVGKGAFREGYQAAQAEARALLGGERSTDQQKSSAAHWCSNCEGIDPGTCLANPDRPRTNLYAQSGIDTPGCDCGHDGMGLRWHGEACAWVVSLLAEARELLAAASAGVQADEDPEP